MTIAQFLRSRGFSAATQAAFGLAMLGALWLWALPWVLADTAATPLEWVLLYAGWAYIVLAPALIQFAGFLLVRAVWLRPGELDGDARLARVGVGFLAMCGGLAMILAALRALEAPSIV
ncbi:hypothetical protein [Tahibacter amnicola]|uniref:Uncharacterized protein n=1 Tax=Tahibacter amnicola TaxID=2976241 RepID=A0ABY6BET2_9GAMM|nr:hypothetical protein [Tahibacter amnicola]UXI68369.1 hypothetical protein N4264_01575 [Tahibacter amnicola]